MSGDADCEFSDVCVILQGEALAASGDLMGEDPWCEHKPDTDRSGVSQNKSRDNMGRRGMERLKMSRSSCAAWSKRIGAVCEDKGIVEYNPEMMEEMRKRVSGGGMRPVTVGKSRRQASKVRSLQGGGLGWDG